MSYIVIHPFRDLEDKGKSFPEGRLYTPGETYPATKKKISDERLEALSTSNNRQRKALIKKTGDT